jgi:hypothetical protein
MNISRALKDLPELAGLLPRALALEACLRDAAELYVWGLEEGHVTARAVRQASLPQGSDTTAMRTIEELLGLRKNSVPVFAASS